LNEVTRSRQQRRWTGALLIATYAVLVVLFSLFADRSLLWAAIMEVPVIMAIVVPAAWLAMGVARSMFGLARSAFRPTPVDLYANVNSDDSDDSPEPDRAELDDDTLLDMRARRKDRKKTRQDRSRNQPAFSRRYL